MPLTKPDKIKRPAGMRFEAMRDRVKAMPCRPLTESERADWAFGNTVMENSAITREMAKRAAQQFKVHQE